MLHYNIPRAVTGATPAVGSDLSHIRSAPNVIPDVTTPVDRVAVPNDEIASIVPRALTRQEPVLADAKPWYKREVWLVLGLGAFLPVTLAITVAQEWTVPLLALAGAMVVASTVLLVRQPAEMHASENHDRVHRAATTTARD